MIRLIFSTLLILHGLLHMIGFAREWGLALRPRANGKSLFEFSESASNTAGVMWLVASVLFVASAVLYLLRKENYWIPATAGLLISQTLIIIYWQDARYGTLINIAILIVIIFAAAAMHFNSMVRREVTSLREHATTEQMLVTEQMVSRLPSPVQQWIRKSDIIGKKMKNVIRVEQKGSLRSTADAKWMPFEAVEYFSVYPPAFIWQAKVKPAPFIHIAGRDKFMNGQGNMLIKPLSLFTAANSSGDEINQGTLIRYMAEVAWFPHACVSNHLQWEEIDERHAKVTMKVNDVSASGTVTFDENGDPIRFEADRYGDFDGVLRKEKWVVNVTGFKVLNGSRIGYTNEVTWKLKDGDFTWFRLELTEID